jgi:hypothetical protein
MLLKQGPNTGLRMERINKGFLEEMASEKEQHLNW